MSRDDEIKLYLALVDQIQKYNTILWQAPTALVAANLFARDRLAAEPPIIVILALVNGALIFAFYRLVLQQGILIDTTRRSETQLRESYGTYIPNFEESGISARRLAVWTLVVADVALFAWHDVLAGWDREVNRMGVNGQYPGNMADAVDKLTGLHMIEPTEMKLRIAKPQLSACMARPPERWGFRVWALGVGSR